MDDKKIDMDQHKDEGSDSSRRDRVDRPSFYKDRPSPYSRGQRSVGPRPSTTPRLPPYNRVFIQNIPYEEKWQGLKDLFRDKVGEVTYVELFTDDAGKSRGYGIVEFKTKELCEKAVEKMNRHEINSRKILIKLVGGFTNSEKDYDGELCRRALLRDNHPAVMGLSGPPMHGMPPPMPGPPPHHMHPLPPMPPPMGLGPAGMGLPHHIPPPMRRDHPLDDIHRGPPHSVAQGVSVFVANLDYKVTYSKLKEVFSLAGRVIKIDLILDKDNKSRGMATVTFETQLQAENAISMLNNQKLYDRTMVVKMDRANPREKGHGDLPSGLSGVGPSIEKKEEREHLPPEVPDIGASRGGYGDTGNGLAGGLPTSDSLSTLAAISELGKTNVAQSKLAAGLSALTRLGDRLPSAGGLDLEALTGLGELARLGLAGAARNERLEQRLIDERIRLLTNPGNALSDRERIERDIQRVDSRIRDIDRSLERGRDLVASKPMPPMPPPMHIGSVPPDTTVFVRNLPYSVSWQTLRDKFSRCGRVLFAEIKNDNGKSRGYGSVRFETPEQAESAVRHLDGMDIEGRKILVHLDRKK